MTSLRVRLLVTMLGLVTVIVVAGIIGAFLLGNEERQEFMDRQLQVVAENLGDLPAPLPGTEDIEDDPDDVIAIQVWDATGALVRESPPGIGIPRQPTEGFRNIEGATMDWRTYSRRTGGWTVQVSQTTAERDELAAANAIGSLLPLLALLPLSWLLVGGVVGFLLKPVTDLSDLMQVRAAGSFDPLPLEKLPRELKPLVTSLNGLLARQHDLLAARQRFVSDAAHQLRTPITAMRLQIENLARASSDSDIGELVADVQRGADRMSALAGQLLTLARAEDPQAEDTPHDLELGELVRTAIADVVVLADDAGVDLGFAQAGEICAACRPESVRMILVNLLDNAIGHSPRGAEVDVELNSKDGWAVVRVLDQGPGIPPGDIGRMFERFERGATVPRDGSGLGLPIAKALADREGATLTLENRSPGPGLIAELCLSLAPTVSR